MVRRKMKQKQPSCNQIKTGSVFPTLTLPWGGEGGRPWQHSFRGSYWGFNPHPLPQYQQAETD